MTCGQHVESPVVDGFLAQDYGYKSVDTQIPLDAMLATIFPAGNEPGTAVYEAVTLSLRHSGGLL